MRIDYNTERTSSVADEGVLMDRITKSLLEEFCVEHELSGMPEDRQFEIFSGYLTVRRHFSETFNPVDIATGSGGDTGIDALAVIVNNNLVTDVDMVEELSQVNGYLEVIFVFVQAERSAGFESGKIGNFGFGVRDFFQDSPQLPRNEMIKDASAVMAAIYKRSSKFTRGNPTCRLYYVTTGKWQNDVALEARRRTEVEDIAATRLFSHVDMYPIGADGIQKLYNQTKNAISREFSFPNRTVVPEISGVKEAHLGFLSATEFLNIICDEDGELIGSLFYENVRDWQDYNEVNSEIKATLESDDRDRFVLMNNGITIIAKALQTTANRFVISDFQVVNGCQTSHVLYYNRKLLGDSVKVPVRLISTPDESVFSAIIRATNRQTEVKKEQFFALTDFAKKLEQFFQTFPVEQKLFYERRSRQYDSLQIEKTRIVQHQNLVRAFGAMFLGEAHRTTRNFASLLAKVGKEIFVDTDRPEPYYTAAYALYKLEYQFRSQRLSSKYKPARFALLYAARLLANPLPLPQMNSHEMARYCSKIDEIMGDPNKANAIFASAAQVIDNVAKGDFNRDNIRTQPFTEEVERQCGQIAASDP